MPQFTFNSPDGKSYTMNAPDGATQQQAWKMLQQHLGQSQPQSAPTPSVPQQPAPQVQAPATQPYQPVGPSGNYGGVAVGPFGAGTMPNVYSTGQLQAAQQGVNIDANAGVSTARANFQATQEKRDAIVAQEIKAKYGPNTPTRTGADGLEFYNAKADGGRGQWMSAGDSFGGQAVNAIPATGEAVGSTIGGLLPWETVGMAAGDATGRFTGDLVKNGIGTIMYPQDVKDFPSLGDMAKDAAAHGAMALGGGVLLSGIPAGFRLGFRGQDVLRSPEAIRAVLRDYQANLSKVQEMNSVLATQGKAPLKMSIFRIAAMSGNPTDIQNSYALNAIDKEQVLAARSEDAAARLQTNSQYNQHAVEDYYLAKNEDPYNYNNITQQNWQSNLKRIFQNFKDGVLGPFQQDAEAAVQKALAAARQNPSFGQLDTNKLSQIVQDTITNKMKSSQDNKNALWAAYEESAGYKPNAVESSIKIPLTPEVQALRQKFLGLSKNGLLPQQRAQGARYVVRASGEDEELSQDLSPLDQALSRMENGVNEDTKTVDLAMLDRTIKDLRLESRRSAAGTVADDMSDENRNSLLGGLVDMRQQWMDLPENAEINAALQKAETATAAHAETFKRGFVADFLNRDASGHIGVADPTLLHTFLTSARRTGVPDVNGATQLASLVNGNPMAHSAILDYAHALYQNDYTKILGEDAGKMAGQRILDPVLNTKWNEEVMPTLDPFLTKAERLQFRKLGGQSVAVASAKEKLVKAQEAWNNMDSGKMGARLQSETFVNQFFDKNKSFGDQNLGFIKYRLDGIGTGNTDALDTTRAGIVQAVGDRVRTDGILDPKKLFSVYTPLKNRFQAYFGKKYTDAMDTILPVLKGLQNNPRWGESTFTADPYSGQSKLGYWVRYGVLGPLSSDNRKLTIMENLRSQSYYSRMERAMYDTNELTKLAIDLGRFGFRANRARLGGAVGTGAAISINPTDRRGSSIPQQKQQGQGMLSGLGF